MHFAHITSKECLCAVSTFEWPIKKMLAQIIFKPPQRESKLCYGFRYLPLFGVSTNVVLQIAFCGETHTAKFSLKRAQEGFFAPMHRRVVDLQILGLAKYFAAARISALVRLCASVRVHVRSKPGLSCENFSTSFELTFVFVLLHFACLSFVQEK